MKKTPKIIAQSLVKAFGYKTVEPLNRLISELDQFHAAVRQSPYFKSLKALYAKASEKRRLLESTLPRFPFGTEFGATLHCLADLNQMADLPKVIEALREFRMREFKVVEAEIITAAPLSETQKTQAVKTLSKLSGFEVMASQKTNRTILGGLVFHLGDTVIDASLARKIRNLNKHLIA